VERLACRVKYEDETKISIHKAYNTHISDMAYVAYAQFPQQIIAKKIVFAPASKSK